MKKVICVDATQLTQVKEGETYFVTEETTSTYYISRFPRAGSHVGQFQKSRFKDVEAIEEKTDLYLIYFKAFDQVYECYGFISKNNLLALYTSQNLSNFIGTTSLEKCESYETIGKTFKIAVMPTPLTKLSFENLKLVQEENHMQLSLF